MAILISTSSGHLAIEFMGYEFPEVEGDEYDSNGLAVRYSGQLAGEGFLLEEPNLYTFEVEHLIDWLRKHASGEDAESVFEFYEPWIRMMCEGQERRGKAKLVVVLTQCDEGARFREFRFQKQVTRSELGELADQFERELRRFPTRAV